MAILKKGLRTIVVDGRRYRWRALGTDDGIALDVVTDDALVHGRHGQWLRARFPYGSRLAATSGGWLCEQRVVVSSGLVRRAIELGRGRAPPFTGQDGAPDVVLTADEAAALVARGPEAFVDEELRRVEALVRGGEGGGEAEGEAEDHAAGERVLGIFLELGRALERRGSSTLRERAAERTRTLRGPLAAWAPRLAAAVERVIDDVERSPSAWERCCERRSGLQFLVDLAGGDTLGLDLARLDEAIARRSQGGRQPSWPRGIPASHVWWRRVRS